MDKEKEHLVKLAYAKMPFGKYQGRYLSDIPDYYYVWFKQKGFPKGNLGALLEEMYEIKLNGLEYIFKEIRSHSDKK